MSHSNSHSRLSPMAKNLNSSKEREKRDRLAHQVLVLGDFSRYGSHTLELSKEIKDRITVEKVGRIGGGFMGSVQKFQQNK